MNGLAWAAVLLCLNVVFFVLNAIWGHPWWAGLSAFAAGMLAGPVVERLLVSGKTPCR